MYIVKVLCFIVTFTITISENAAELRLQSTPDDLQPIVFSTKYFQQAKDELKMCRYRGNGLFPITLWNPQVGAGCYQYLQSDWFKQRLTMAEYKFPINNVTYKVLIGLTEEGSLLTFDYTNPNYSKIIAHSFASDIFYTKWRNCAIKGEICCTDFMTDINIHPDEDYPCPATWDAWSCFGPATADSITELPCPDITSSSSAASCVLYSQKECFANGTWNQQTSYINCPTAPIYKKRHEFHVTVLYISIGLSFPAVVIFMSYKNLRILRVNLHRNLLIACIMRNVFTILSKELVVLDSLRPSNETNHVLETNGVGCRTLAFLNNVAANAIYACMLIDGFYLHKLIVRIFSSDPNPYILYVITGVLSILPSTIWGVLLAVGQNDYCWMVDTSWYQWIPDGFRVAILAINIILLVDIVRALCCKLRQNITAQHTKYSYILINNGLSYNSVIWRACASTLKATLFLIPLFGVPFILTANRNIVDQSSCKEVDIFFYVSYSLQALQGIMVAILFCYWNNEVHTLLKGSFRKLNLQYQIRIKSKNDGMQTTYRRETARTYVPNESVAQPFNNLDNRRPTENSNQRVSDWLVENHTHQTISPTQINLEEKLSQDMTTKFEELELSNGVPVKDNLEENALSNRISKFIDDSNENLQHSQNNSPEIN